MSYCNQISCFSIGFESQIKNLMKISHVGAEVTHVGRRTDMTKVIAFFMSTQMHLERCSVFILCV